MEVLHCNSGSLVGGFILDIYAVMAAASYYNGDPQGPSPQLRPQENYGNSPYKLPTVPSQSQLYTGSGYNGPNEGSALAVEPLLNKPANQRPPSSTTTHQGPQKLHMVDPSLNRIQQRKYQQWKRYLRAGQLLARSITILFSTIMFGIMVFVTIKYQTTKDPTRGGRTAWPKTPKLWPTFMLLAASGVTLALSLITLCAAFCCTNFNRARRSSWKLTVIKYVIHIAAWAAVSIVYRYEKSLHGVDDDLWGWSCSAEVAALQSEFKDVVDFGVLCESQVSRLILLKRKNPSGETSLPPTHLRFVLTKGENSRFHGTCRSPSSSSRLHLHSDISSSTGKREMMRRSI